MPLVPGGEFQTCVVYDSDFIGYDDEECTLPYCFACTLQSKNFFKLKGLCGESATGSDIFDSDYLLMFGYPHMTSFHFRGFTGLTSIYYDEEYQRWILNSYRLVVIVLLTASNFGIMTTSLLIKKFQHS